MVKWGTIKFFLFNKIKSRNINLFGKVLIKVIATETFLTIESYI